MSLMGSGRALKKMSPELLQVYMSWPDGQDAGMSSSCTGTRGLDPILSYLILVLPEFSQIVCYILGKREVDARIYYGGQFRVGVISLI